MGKMEDLAYVFIFLLFVGLYSLPSILSAGKVRFWLIFLINFLSGWSIIGRIIAMILALDKNNKKVEETEVKNEHPITIASLLSFIEKNIWFFILGMVIVVILITGNIE